MSSDICVKFPDIRKSAGLLSNLSKDCWKGEPARIKYFHFFTSSPYDNAGIGDVVGVFVDVNIVGVVDIADSYYTLTCSQLFLSAINWLPGQV